MGHHPKPLKVPIQNLKSNGLSFLDPAPLLLAKLIKREMNNSENFQEASQAGEATKRNKKLEAFICC